jgi:hypothetical protein
VQAMAMAMDQEVAVASALALVLSTIAWFSIRSNSRQVEK